MQIKQIKKKLAYIALSSILLLISHMLILQNSIPLLPQLQAEDKTAAKSASVVEAIPEKWSDDPASQMVFFAVLEGLYTDGIPNEIVDLIIPRHPTTGEPNLTEHFVYKCPLCSPAIEAFRLYRLRPNFAWLKEERNTFGAGSSLDAKLIETLKSGGRRERLYAIQDLIMTWVSRRLNLMRLTPEEGETWSKKIEALRQEGMRRVMALGREGLKSWPFKFCAICDGSVDACKLPIRNMNE